MNTRILLTALTASVLAPAAHATLIYDTWTSNDASTGNYVLTVTENGSLFDVLLTVSPWNAEALGLFVDLGNLTVTDTTLTNVNPVGQVALFATDTTSNGCGPGCNLDGLAPALANPDGDWEWVFRLGTQGWNGIQTFSFSFATNGATESDWGVVGIRSQQLCSGTNLLPTAISTCEGSDKSYGTGTPAQVPEPASLGLLLTGLLAAGLVRRRARA